MKAGQLAAIALFAATMTGCGESDVDKAYSELEKSMSRSEADGLGRDYCNAVARGGSLEAAIRPPAETLIRRGMHPEKVKDILDAVVTIGDEECR